MNVKALRNCFRYRQTCCLAAFNSLKPNKFGTYSAILNLPLPDTRVNQNRLPVGLQRDVRHFYTTRKALNQFIFNVQDEKDFNERVKLNKTPVIVDFHATWCGPCKILGPRLETLITSKEGKVILAKIDIDELSELAMKYDVEAVPTVLGLKDGKVVDRFIGVIEDDVIESFIEKMIGHQSQ